MNTEEEETKTPDNTSFRIKDEIEIEELEQEIEWKKNKEV